MKFQYNATLLTLFWGLYSCAGQQPTHDEAIVSEHAGEANYTDRLCVLLLFCSIVGLTVLVFNPAPGSKNMGSRSLASEEDHVGLLSGTSNIYGTASSQLDADLEDALPSEVVDDVNVNSSNNADVSDFLEAKRQQALKILSTESMYREKRPGAYGRMRRIGIVGLSVISLVLSLHLYSNGYFSSSYSSTRKALFVENSDVEVSKILTPVDTMTAHVYDTSVTAVRSGVRSETSGKLTEISASMGFQVSAINEYGDTHKPGIMWAREAVFMEPYKSHTLTIIGNGTNELTSDATLSNLLRDLPSYTNVKATWTVQSDVTAHDDASGLPSSADSVENGNIIATGLFDVRGKESLLTTTNVVIEGHGLKILVLDFSGTDTTGQEMSVIVRLPLYVKYVRRELFTLTDADRELFLNTMHTLWTVSTTEGQKLYGDEYRSIHYFTQIHVDGPAFPECDLFHEGPGFVVNHVYLDYYMQQSMQRVNPAAVLHYLDYVKFFESDEFSNHLLNSYDGGSYSPLFSELWFGKSDPNSGEIIDGRWAYLKAPKVSKEFYELEGIPDLSFWEEHAADWDAYYTEKHAYSVYGFLKPQSSFSLDGAVLRFHDTDAIKALIDIKSKDLPFTGVSCAKMNGYMTEISEGHDVAYAAEKIEYHAHGPAHFSISGYGGQDLVASDVAIQKFAGNSLTTVDFASISYDHHHFLKFSAPAYYIDVTNASSNYNPKDNLLIDSPILVCDAFPTFESEFLAEKNIECTMDVDYDDEDAMDAFLSYFTGLASVNTGESSDTATELLTRLLALDKASKEQLIRSLGDRPFSEGELSGSSAPLDPFFWVLHGQVLRVYQKMTMSDILTTLEYNATSAFDTCAGHSNVGTKLWLQGLQLADGSTGVDKITNRELSSYLEPESQEFVSKFNYVFDTVGDLYCGFGEGEFNR